MLWPTFLERWHTSLALRDHLYRHVCEYHDARSLVGRQGKARPLQAGTFVCPALVAECRLSRLCHPHSIVAFELLFHDCLWLCVLLCVIIWFALS